MSNVSAGEQKDIIKLIVNESVLQEGDRQAFLISVKWHDRWKEYVGYDGGTTGEVEMTPIDNAGIVDIDGNVIPGVTEGSDYAVLLPAEWTKLCEWYGGGPEVAVPAVRYAGGLVVPSNFYKLAVSYGEHMTNMCFHNLVTVKAIEKQLRRKFMVDNTIQTRLISADNGAKSVLPDGMIGHCVNGTTRLIMDTRNSAGAWRERIDTEEIPATSFYSPVRAISIIPRGVEVNRRPDPPYRQYYGSPGAVGLVNLGNTCYFNSALQCLLHTKPLTQFFLGNKWKNDLNVRNPIGMRGELASEFAGLMNKMWSGREDIISPSYLKEVIGRFASQFRGYAQQDAHELIMFLMDGIHEDLNRCMTKPIVEAIDGTGMTDEQVATESWRRYKTRNDSAIVDLFHGQLRSELICPQCKEKEVVFDPYMTLQLPVQRPKHRTIYVSFVPFNVTDEYHRLHITLSLSADASAVISELLKRTVTVVLLTCEGGSYGFGLRESTGTCTYYAVEIPDTTQFYVIGRVRISGRGDVSGPMAVNVPCFDLSEVDLADLFMEKLEILLVGDDVISPEEEHEIAVLKSMQGVTPVAWCSDGILKVVLNDHDYCNTHIRPLNSYPYVGSRVVVVYINSQLLDRSSWKGIAFMNRQRQQAHDTPRVREAINLNKCFGYFCMSEVLDEQNRWFCRRCREHVCAEKKMDVWSVPRILVVHLKRFVAGRCNSKKFDGFIEFPDVLDMGPIVRGPHDGAMSYKLYAVSEHMGGLGGGHYTARSIVASKDRDDPGEWYAFNDSCARKTSSDTAHTDSAYILFYERIGDAANEVQRASQ